MTLVHEEIDIDQIVHSFQHLPVNESNRTKLTQHLRHRLDFIGVDWTRPNTDVEMLDYACGPGFLSRIFAPHVSSITAIDSSQQTLNIYNANVATLDIPIQALVADFVTDLQLPASIADEIYHLITVGAGLRHLPDPEGTVKCLAERLRSGGVLFLQDLFDDERGSKRRRGSTLDELRSLTSGAGLVNFRFEVLPDEVEVEMLCGEVVRMKCFVARAVKRRQ